MRTRENNIMCNLVIAIMTVVLFFIVYYAKSEKPEIPLKAKYNKVTVKDRFKYVEFSADSSYAAVNYGNGDTVNFRVIYLEK